MSMPVTSAPICARGTAVVPSPHPRSSTRCDGVAARDLTNDSPDWRMQAAISVKSPFSHSALFGFMMTFFLSACSVLLILLRHRPRCNGTEVVIAKAAGSNRGTRRGGRDHQGQDGSRKSGLHRC